MKQLRPWQAPIFQIFPLLLICLALSWLSPTLSETYQRFKDCAPINYTCGNLTVPVAYPFRIDRRHDYCGYKDYFLICSNNRTLTINIGDRLYQVKGIDYMNHMLKIADPSPINHTCPLPLGSTTLDLTLYEYSERDLNLTFFFNCTPLASNSVFHDVGCNSSITGHRSYYQIDGHDDPLDLPRMCSSTMNVSVDQAAISMLENDTSSFGDVLLGGFSAKWIAGKGWCSNCSLSGGLCGYNVDSPSDHTCICSYGLEIGTCSSEKKGVKNIIIGVATGGAGFLGLCCCLFLFLYRRRKRQQQSSSSLLLRSPSFGQSPNKDPELGSTIYKIQNFTYMELQEATDGFDDSKELGDGGFGTVYKGKLRDGRTVAVKRLYENNYRRVEQFMNEIVILSRLRHQNLVTLYGCSSRHSRELVLVYEFVPNGTVADHLHGSRAAEGALTWPIRMNIAIETADALAYLHAIEPQIIHRDVKTNNILLDNGFHVKVADFGLSRLFPLDATHVSTAPQGTPGYVDPEYHQCYQLTDKSDVYSFGVVLIELISSKPAVDISRHRHEINLASMAVHKIQNRELNQLVDPGLGYESDSEVKSMITQVAELAFRCLQADGDMRPPIKEALEVLQGIQSGWKKAEKATDSDANTRNGTPLLKTAVPYSPDSVTNQWASRSTTSNASN